MLADISQSHSADFGQSEMTEITEDCVVCDGSMIVFSFML